MDPECSLRPRLIALDEAATSLGVFKHDLSFTAAIPVTRRVPTTVDTLVGQLKGSLERYFLDHTALTQYRKFWSTCNKIKVTL